MIPIDLKEKKLAEKNENFVKSHTAAEKPGNYVDNEFFVKTKQNRRRL